MRLKSSYWLPVALVAGLALLADRHWHNLGLDENWRVPLNAIAFLYLSGLLLLARLNKTYTYRKTNKLRTAVIVPVFNEDPKTFLAMLQSLDKQTLRPTKLHVIDDASSNKDCQQVFKQWAELTEINAKYTMRRKNTGKREVQAVGFRANRDVDIYITIDSDTILERKAIKNGLRPFGEPRVMSVAGLLLGLNAKSNLLTRLVDLGFTCSFINGRAAWSQLHSVAVNCGGLAFYRSNVIHTYLGEYLKQTVFGRKASTGDDRILTNFALLEGWAVFQSSSIGYTLLPEKFSHLIRQRIRWWRSFFWGGVWLLRRFPINRIVWWLVTWQFVSFIFYTVIMCALVLSSVEYSKIPWEFIVYLSIALAYLKSLPYLELRAPDRNFVYRLNTYLMAPLSTILHIFLCSILQYVGLFTVFRTGWGTRSQVEVEL